MRVLLCCVEGNDIQREVIGGEFFDPCTGHCGLEDTFTVRCDDGAVFEVHGWLVDVTVLEGKFRLAM